MKLNQLLIVLLMFSFLGVIKNVYSQEKQSDGILFKFNKTKSTDAKWLKIQICSDDIIRVIASPVESFSKRESLIVDKKVWDKVKWDVKENGDWTEISTAKVVVKVNNGNGQIKFFDTLFLYFQSCISLAMFRSN